AGLGGGVVRAGVEPAAPAGVGRDHDDAPAALPAHGEAGGLGAEEGALEVDVEQQVPVGFFQLEDGLALEQAGVVDEDVDAAEGGERGGDDAAGLRDVAEVGGMPGGATAEGADLLADGGAGLGVAAVDEDVGALAGEGEG